MFFYSRLTYRFIYSLLSSVLFLFPVSTFADSTFVSGTIVNETWSKTNSPYCVEGDIFIAGLTIEPGVKVLFIGNYVFEVGGVLTAVGTEQDSIKFTKADTANAWRGIFFNFSQPGSELAYCVIDSSANRGLRIDQSSPQIKNSTIKYNSSSGWGGGIWSNSNLTLVDCNIENNSISGRLGGGIYSEGELSLINCTVSNNTIFFLSSTNTAAGGGIYSSGKLTMLNCLIVENLARSSNSNAYAGATAVGGGIYFRSDSLSLKNCVISNNESKASANTAAEVVRGGGIYISDGIANLTNCIFSYNTLGSRLQWGGSAATGGGIYINAGNISSINCTIAFNEYDGIFRKDGNVEIYNSIIWENDNGSDQIIGTSSVSYSDVQGSYAGTGNINFNPLFLSEQKLKIVEGSPCIDTGNPDSVFNDKEDPNNIGFARTPSLGFIRNDMGAHGGPGAIGWLDSSITSIKKENLHNSVIYSLYQNYPNPFNPTSQIRYDLPKASFVNLTIYNALGQKVTTLVNNKLPASSHTANFNGSGLASGVYYYRLQADGFVQTRKMLLLR